MSARARTARATRLTPSFTTLKYLSFAHSTVYAILLAAWLIPGLHASDAATNLQQTPTVPTTTMSNPFPGGSDYGSTWHSCSPRPSSRRSHTWRVATSRPPPRVNPPTPVVEMIPLGTANPKA